LENVLNTYSLQEYFNKKLQSWFIIVEWYIIFKSFISTKKYYPWCRNLHGSYVSSFKKS
jgi:hypothetical protein